MNLIRALTFLGLILMTACSPEPNSVSKESDIKTIRFGTLKGEDTDVVSNLYTNGFSHDLAEAFAGYLDSDFIITGYPTLPSLYKALSNNEIDIIAARLTKSDVYPDQFLQSPTMFKSDQVVVGRRGGKQARKVTELSGTIAAASGSAYAQTLEGLTLPEQAIVLSLPQQGTAELLEMVWQKELDFTIADTSTVRLLQRFMPELKVLFTLKHRQTSGWLLKRNTRSHLMSELLDFWNTIQIDGTLDHLQEKHFGHTAKFDYVDTRVFIRNIQSVLPKYRSLFQKYAGDIDWRKIAATAYQESHWKPNARSPTGVRGIMMLTRPTAKQMGVSNRLNPEQSIRGGSAYLNLLVKSMPSSIPAQERLWFALASYNVGFGHVEDARKLTEAAGMDPSAWADVKRFLPLLQKRKYYRKTKHGYARGSEAAHYVDNIRRYYDTLILIDELANAKEKSPPASGENSEDVVLVTGVKQDKSTEDEVAIDASEQANDAPSSAQSNKPPPQ